MEEEYQWILDAQERSRLAERAYLGGKWGVEYKSNHSYVVSNRIGLTHYLEKRGKILNKLKT